MVVVAPMKSGEHDDAPTSESEDIENVEATEQEAAVSKEILVIAQEVHIVKTLACNDVTKRNRQIKKLRKWLRLRSLSSFPFAEEDFLRMWKGLYYTMWMSDKPLVQEELAEQLAQLLGCFHDDVEISVNFFGAFMRTMCNEWFGIDQWRIDKFLMLVRRMLRSMFRILKTSNWSNGAIEKFNDNMQTTMLADNAPARGLTMHYFDIFFEELAKVSKGDISAENVDGFIIPFVRYMGTQSDVKLLAQCRTRIFFHLLYQSELGREYTEKYNAWKEMGFPTASIDELEKDESASEDDSQTTEEESSTQDQQNYLDPRAGNVDVFIPVLPLNADCIINELNVLINKPELNKKRRNALKKLLQIFETYKNNEFPLGIKTMPRVEVEPKEPLILSKVNNLENLENEIYGVGRKLKQLNKRKRRKLLKSINFDIVDENNVNDVIDEVISKPCTKDRIKQAQSEMMTGWIEEELTADDVSQTMEVDQSQEMKTGQKHKLEMINNNNDDGEPSKKLKKMNKGEINQKKMAVRLQKVQKEALSEWNKQLKEGEIEYFVPSRKSQLENANKKMLVNPMALTLIQNTNSSTPVNDKKKQATSTPKTPDSVKRVKINLKQNTSQKPSEYVKQIRSSPNVPYDASKKPGKGLLKPNSMPSPINPFYKKKIGLEMLNDTF